MTAPIDDKYIVIKRSDLAELHERFVRNPNYIEAFNIIEEAAIDDGVVIRRQDVFAPPALECYANGIQVAIEVAGRTDEAIHNRFPQRMQRIADYFHQQAAASWEQPRKLPD